MTDICLNLLSIFTRQKLILLSDLQNLVKIFFKDLLADLPIWLFNLTVRDLFKERQSKWQILLMKIGKTQHFSVFLKSICVVLPDKYFLIMVIWLKVFFANKDMLWMDVALQIRKKTSLRLIFIFYFRLLVRWLFWNDTVYFKILSCSYVLMIIIII